MKKTKIVATISDKRCDVEFLKSLHEKGMNVVRINTAHQTPEASMKVIENVRKVSEKIPILIDTKGPEIRTTKVETPIEVKADEIIYLAGNPGKVSTRECVYTNYKKLSYDLKVGVKILIDDGELALKVVKKEGDKLHCKVLNSGIIKGNKSINIPSVNINLPTLSDKDKQFINFAIKNDIDFIAHSFVRNSADLLEIQDILDKQNSNVKLIAKIENQEGVDNINEILDRCQGVMVARGDLGIEIPAEKIPAIQAKLIRKCREHKKAVIIATQMLHTMIHNPRPTRAEVSDIANAVYSETDAIMLSGETAYGSYPEEAVETMARIAIEVEQTKEYMKGLKSHSEYDKIAVFLANMAAKASRKLPVKAIVLETLTGRTARFMAAIRNKQPVLAICYKKRIVREMALFYGVYATYYKERMSTDGFKTKTADLLLSRKLVHQDDLLVFVAGSFGPLHRASFVEINTPFNILNSNKSS